MRLTEFTFFRNTPLVDFMNTIHFKSNQERDDFFLNGGYYEKIEFSTDKFNFIRDRSFIRINKNFFDLQGVNYCTFITDGDNTRYYAFVVEVVYNNDAVTDVTLVIDPVMTYTQGKILNDEIGRVNVKREHLSVSEYNDYVHMLRTNDDILRTSTNKYIYNNYYAFDSFYIIFQCAADLESDFGTKENPNLDTSGGVIYDKITSPLNLYLCEYGHFNDLTRALSPYPWISQNIKKIIMVPTVLVDYNNTEPANPKTIQFPNLRKFKGNTRSRSDFVISELTLNIDELLNLNGLTNDQLHLLRSGYITIEYYTWGGEQLTIDAGELNTAHGLEMKCMVCIGHYNHVAFYVDHYKSEDSGETGYEKLSGSFLNETLSINTFNELPILLDQGALALANRANQIAYNDSMQPSKRLNTVLDSNATLNDRFFSAVNLTSRVTSGNIVGMFSDEYEYFRRQKAEFADLALTPPTVGASTDGGSFQIANDIYGVTIKISSLDPKEWEKIKKYSAMYGHQIDEDKKFLSDVEGMTICNYIKFDGDWLIPSIDIGLMEMLRTQFANGVRFWHNNETANPFNQNVENNRIKGY